MHRSKINLPLVAILIGLSISTFFLTNRSLSPSKNTQAADHSSCNCFEKYGEENCYSDGCTRKPLNDPNLCEPPNSPAYNIAQILPAVWCNNPPPCCDDIVRTGNAHACCWTERGACTPAQCDFINGSKEQCGWYWGFHDNATNTSKGYGCMIGDSRDTMRPISGSYPPEYYLGEATNTPIPQQPTATNTPIPQNQPTLTKAPTLPPIQPTVTTAPFIPTATPITNPPNPTSIFQFPTRTPQIKETPQPTAKPFSLSLPKAPSLSIKQKIDVVKVEAEADKTLGFFEYVFNRIRQYDNQLETSINDWFIRAKEKLVP